MPDPVADRSDSPLYVRPGARARGEAPRHPRMHDLHAGAKALDEIIPCRRQRRIQIPMYPAPDWPAYAAEPSGGHVSTEKLVRAQRVRDGGAVGIRSVAPRKRLGSNVIGPPEPAAHIVAT